MNASGERGVCVSPAQRTQLRLLDNARSSGYVRRAAEILKGMHVDAEKSAQVLGLLSVELTARPLTARAVEWITVAILPVSVKGRITTGPFQLKGGPFAFHRSLRRTLAAIEVAEPRDLADVARFWNGSLAGRRAREDLWSYEEMLKVAIGLADEPLPRSSCEVCRQIECALATAVLNSPANRKGYR